MDINFFIKQFAEQFDETDLDIFKSETDFKNIEEWSSLTALSVIAMVDGCFGVRINGDDIRSANTINDLFKIVISKR
ncbi:MAG: acyl carrier protein [Flavobacterium sp.]|uniref:acyl carrier protein n=1 Tax=Flavobacterium sp. TaxID=239 RepID=UPI003BD3836B